MGISSLLRKLIGIAHIVCLGWRLEGSDLIVNVRPSWRYPRCGKCGKRAPGYDQRKPSRCRHLSFGVTRFWLEYAPRRVDCPTCGIHHEQVPWADLGSRFTRPMQGSWPIWPKRWTKPQAPSLWVSVGARSAPSWKTWSATEWMRRALRTCAA